MEWNPIKISVKIIQKIGREKAIFLSENLFTANKAIPAIGVKLGGWGKSLVTTAKKINAMITKFRFMSY